MKNNRLLKIYLLTACASVLLFLGSFAIGWHLFDNMADMYSATLPFLFIAIGSLAAFGFTPEVKESRAVRAEVVSLKAYRRSHSCCALRKIS